MLNRLFGSKSRVKILKLFLFNPEEKYYLRQIARDLFLQVNSVRRELENLKKFGLLIAADADSGKDKKYYTADKNFVLFPEIKAVIEKSQILSAWDFVAKLKEFCQPDYVSLGGSFVDDKISPIDIFIVAEVKKSDLFGIIKDFEKDLGRELNFSLMNLEEFRYRREVTDIFLYNILEGKKIVLIDDLRKIMKILPSEGITKVEKIM